MTRAKARRRQIVLGGLAGVGSLVAGPLLRNIAHAQGKPDHTMLLAHTFSEATEKYVVTGIDQFKQAAEKYSQGKLLVDVHGSGKLGGQNVLPQKVQQGAIQASAFDAVSHRSRNGTTFLISRTSLLPTRPSKSFCRTVSSCNRISAASPRQRVSRSSPACGRIPGCACSG